MSREPHWVDLAISRLLRGGVLISIAVVLLGAAITFVRHPSYVRSGRELGRLTSPAMTYPSSVATVVHGAEAQRGQAIMMAGLLLLIATPVARVGLSIAVFVVEHDRLYIVITSVVLLLLLTSFALGAAG